jgi:ribosomal protein S12 methylthiotransferase accessory factor
VDLVLDDRTPIEESSRRLERLASPYTGIVRVVDALTHCPDDARLFRFACEVAADRSTIGVDPPSIFTSGQHHSRLNARVAALAEAAERYSGFYIPSERVRAASAQDADFPVAQPESFALFSEAQYARPGFPFQPFRRSVRTQWIDGFRVATGEEVFLPVQRVYMMAVEQQDAEEPALTYATSNGMACGATLDEALLAGLLEVVERDAFMIAWSNKLTLPHLDWRSDRGLRDFSESYLSPSGLSFDAIDLTQISGVPTIVACVRGVESDLGAIGFGTAAALDIREAWKKALSEAFFTRVTARDLHFGSPDRSFDDDYWDIVDFPDHMLFYAFAENVPLADFLFASDEFVRPDPSENHATRVRTKLDYLTGVVESQGGDVLAVEITAPEIRELGLTVAKVIVPQYCDLNTAHGGQFLGGERLYTRASDVGLRAAPLSLGDLNRDPHPMG